MEVCEAIEIGLLRNDQSIRISKVPLADGGEGSLEILQRLIDLQKISLTVEDPLGRPVRASYGISGEAAFIEMAQASGLGLLSTEERDCLYTTTYGTGQLIMDAYRRGLSRIFLFVGGSATNDGGIGILSALGIQPVGDHGTLLPIGKSLSELTGFIESDTKVDNLSITVVCDVLNPLYGPRGAAFVYAPQKGASPKAVELLDQGLQNLARVILRTRNIRVDDIDGAGAAGGVAAGIMAHFDTKIQRGFDVISEIAGLEEAVASADLVITGEGKFDQQTLQGKVVKGVYDLCNRKGKKLAVICGVLDLDPHLLKSLKIWKVMPLVDVKTSFDQARKNAYKLVCQRAFELLSNHY